MTAKSSLMIDYLGYGTHAARPATPNTGTGVTVIYYETDTGNTFAWTGSAWVQINGAGTGGPGADGWISAGETWTYASVDGPTGTFTVAADVTTKYQVGMRVKLTQTTVKYFIITGVSTFSGGNTTITIYGGTDYTLANAAISSNYYTYVKAPVGFNCDPAKWTETFTDTTTRTQSSPAAGTWYNVGPLSISIPIGVWNVEYTADVHASKTATTSCDAELTLSTANNSESDKTMSAYFVHGGASGTTIVDATPYKRRMLTLAAKTTYYLNMLTGVTATSIFISGDPTTIIRAICALL